MTDLELLRASNGSGEAVRAAVTAIRAPGATTLSVDSLSNWPAKFTATAGKLTVVNNITTLTSPLVFTGHTSGANTIIIDSIAPGYSDSGNSVSDVVVLKPTTKWTDTLVDTLEVSLNADGTLKTNSVGASQISDGAVGTSELASNSVTPAKLSLTALSDGSTNGVLGDITSVGHYSGTVAMGYGTTAGFLRRGNVVVVFMNTVTSTFPSNGDNILGETVPLGYRPSTTMSLPAIMVDGASTTGNCYWTIDTLGAMTLFNRNTAAGSVRIVATMTYFTNNPMPA